MPPASPAPPTLNPATLAAPPRTGDGLLQRLRAETAEAHARLEAEVGLEHITASPAAYRALLCRFRGFHAAWEPRATALLGGRAILAERLRLHLLDADLAVLGLSPAEIAALPVCRPLMPLDRPAQALGTLYVMEGSTLGGAVIAAELGRRLGHLPGHGCSYFAAHGPRRGAMWQAFRAALPAEPEAAAEPDAILASAVATFAVLQRWLAGAAG